MRSSVWPERSAYTRMVGGSNPSASTMLKTARSRFTLIISIALFLIFVPFPIIGSMNEGWQGFLEGILASFILVGGLVIAGIISWLFVLAIDWAEDGK